MKTQGFAGIGGSGVNYAKITSVFRDYEKQVEIKNQYGSSAATPGTSNHGWGIAIDLQFYKKDGSVINNDANSPESFKIGTNPAIQWLYDHSYMYGWVLPYSLRDGSTLDEHWHFEYHGTSAKKCVEDHPTVYGFKMNTSGLIKDFVKNPKNPDGTEATYTACDYKYIKQGDGGENCADKITEPKKKATDKQMYDKLKQKTKLNDYAIAGLMGNIFSESGFVPQAFNDGGGGCGAYGLVQWRSSRQGKLGKYAKDNNYAIDSLDAQIGFINKELTEVFTYTYNALKNVGSAELAAKIVHNTYELTILGTTNFSVDAVSNNSLIYKDGNGNTQTAVCATVRIERANAYYEKIKNNSI